MFTTTAALGPCSRNITHTLKFINRIVNSPCQANAHPVYKSTHSDLNCPSNARQRFSSAPHTHTRSPHFHEMSTPKAPKAKVWWYREAVTSKGHTYPEMMHWEGFSVAPTWHDRSRGMAVVVGGCSQCILFRRKRTERSPEPCPCPWHPDQEHPYNLSDARTLVREESDFQRYRRDIKSQIHDKPHYFRNLFLHALECFPHFRYDQIRLRISIDIDKDGVEATSVEVEPLDREAQRGNPWVARSNKWHKTVKRRHRSQYVGVGVVIFDFAIHCLDSDVYFEVQVGLPLRQQDIPWGEEERDPRLPLPEKPPMREPDWEWARWITSEFSDSWQERISIRAPDGRVFSIPSHITSHDTPCSGLSFLE